MTLELQLPTAQGGHRSVPVRQVSAAGGRNATGLQGQRSLAHLVTLAELAAGCGALTAPELAQERLDALFHVAGVA